MRLLFTLLLALLLPLSSADAQTQRRKTRRTPTKTQVTRKTKTTTKKKTTRLQPDIKAIGTKAANDSKEMKQLRGEKETVQRDIKEKEQQLSDTKKNVTDRQHQVELIEGQIKERVTHISNLSTRIDSIDRATRRLEEELEVAAKQLEEKKKRYAESLRYDRTQRSMGGPLYFVLSANTWQQMYRRSRYAREYASWQRSMGEEIMKQRTAMMAKQNKLLAYKNEMSGLLGEVSRQRTLLMGEHREQQKVLGGLKEKQRGLAAEIEKQRKRVAELDKKIDQVIAREIEAARKRAEEAERKRREAEEAERRRLTAAGKATKRTTTTTTRRGKSSPTPTYTTVADRKLNGSFEQNKGRLPVPITGPSRIKTRMGAYSAGRGVTLNNNGVDYAGTMGACARAIFNGEVTAIFSYGGMTNVIVRHGSYMSVYCNLSSVRVHMGQTVKTSELLGTVATDDRGEAVLHFQLRKETTKLNPERWIAR